MTILSCILNITYILQFICKQKWDIALLQELTCEDALNDLVNALNQSP